MTKSQVTNLNDRGPTRLGFGHWTLVIEVGGERIDKYIAAHVPEVSRAEVQRLIKDGFVTLNGAVVKPSHRVEVGDRIVIQVPPPAPVDLLPERIPLDVIYEDADVLVINKPAGMVVHPAAGHASGTLVNAILAHVPDLAGIGGELRPGIVHRLDKETSGLILIAKNDVSLRKLQLQFKHRLVSKIYLALVEGKLSPERGRIDMPIGRDPRERKRMAVSPRHGRPAQTDYRVLEVLGDYTLIEARPLTGRTHQIRVHLAAVGHPVVGDPVYGRRKRKLPLERQFLHAWRLSFELPSTGEPVTFTAPLPEDLRSVLAMLGSRVRLKVEG